MRRCRDNRGVLSRTVGGAETTVPKSKAVGFCHFSLNISVMAYDYDALYATQPNALGAPTAAFVAFFETFDMQAARILDVGCGQGRDALFIAQLGHQVVGVDMSAHGVAAMVAAANADKLAVTGDVADITQYTPDGMFDVVLIDRTLHMLPKPAQLTVLALLVTHVTSDGWLLIADEASNMQGFRDVLTASAHNWTITQDAKGFLFAQAL